ncbi:MAG: hypothetical protein AABW72_02595 [archaeon]
MQKIPITNPKAFFVGCLLVFFLILLYSFGYWHSFSQKESFSEIYFQKYAKEISTEDACFAINVHSFNQKIADSMQIQVNSKQHSSLPINIPENEEMQLEKCLPNSALSLGDNVISASLGNDSIFFHVLKSKIAKISYAAQLPKKSTANKEPIFANLLFFMLFMLSFFFFTYLFSKKFGLLHGTIISIAIFIIQSLFRIFLDYFGILQNAFSLYLVYFAAFCLAYFYLPRIIQPEKKDSENDFDRKAFIASLILVCFFIFLQLFSVSHFSEWNIYYERQTSLFMADSLSIYDPLSYLGRPFTFDPGYFLFESNIAKLSSLSQDYLFAASAFFAILLLFFSSLFLAKSLKFSFPQAMLFFILLITLNFNFTNFLLSPRHIIAVSLMLYASALFITDKKAWVWLGLVAGSLAAIQIPAAIFFALFLFAIGINSRNDLLNKNNIYAAVLAFAVFLFAFASILFKHGLPYTAKMKDWGYLLHLDNGWLMFDMNIVYYLLLFLILLGIFLFKSMDWADRKVYVAMLLSLLLEFTLSFRFNIVTQALFAIFLIKSIFYILPKRYPKIFSQPLLGLAFAILLIFASYATFENIQKEPSQLSTLQELSPMLFASRLPEDSNFLVEPLYGHSLAYFGKQKVLADLYTEYADTKKLDAEYDFLVNGNKAVLEEYSINYVLIYKAGVHTSAQPFIQFDANFSIPYLSKVYTNGLFDLYSTD